MWRCEVYDARGEMGPRWVYIDMVLGVRLYSEADKLLRISLSNGIPYTQVRFF